MSKIALITDTHWGARSDNLSIMDHMKTFLDGTFFPYLKKNKIKTVVHLGDLLDRRKYVNIQTARRLNDDFLQPLADLGVKMHIIPGNHDVYFKNSNEVNSLELLLAGYPNIQVHMKPTEIDFYKTRVLLMPWICDENKEECLKALQETKCQVLFGHLELQGFEMHKGSFCDHGMDTGLFDKFDIVCSGHFHHKSTYQNIHYLGNPFEMTWSDYGDTKGFHTFDTSNRSIHFVPNPNKLFHKIHYSDSGKEFTEVMDVDFGQYANSYVKVIIGSKENPFLYDRFITSLEEAGVIDVKAVDDHLNLSLEADDEIIDQAESTLDILQKTVKQSGIADIQQERLVNLLRSLYNEASLLQA